MQTGFFDLSDRYELLEQLGDPLPKIKQVVDWEAFREALEQIRPDTDPRKGGRPPLDLSLIHISEPTRQYCQSRMPSSA